MPLTTIAALVAACALPAVAFWLLSHGFDRLVGHTPRRPRATVAVSDPDSPGALAALAALGADLRRLDDEHTWLLSTDVPGRATRLRAVRLAYDDTLLQAASLLDVDVPAPPLHPATRLQTEAELTTHGLRW